MDLPELFSASGPLARAFEGYCVRIEQIEMSQAILDAIRNAKTVVLEAGTGVGKTAAYLVPLLLEGGKVIISTGTKALQDQLYHRDLPAVRDALAVPVKTALLKGRSNYLCWHHLDRTKPRCHFAGQPPRGQRPQPHQPLHSPQPDRRQGRVSVGARARQHLGASHLHTRKLPGQRVPALQRLLRHEGASRSTRRRCRGGQPPPVLCRPDAARRGRTELLPTAQTIIFDEAHQLPDTATLFFGDTLSTAQLLDFLRDALATGMAQARCRPLA